MLISIFDNEAQSGIPDCLLSRAQDPYSRLVHFDNRIHAFPRAEHDVVDLLRNGHGIAVQRNHLKLMPRQRNAAVFNRARIEQVHQHPLALPHPNRLPCAQRLVVDGVSHRIDFKAGRIGVQNRGFLRLRSGMAIIIIVLHVAGEERFPVAQREKNLPVILAGVFPPVHIDEAKLSGIGPSMQVGLGHGVRVVPARARRTRRKLIAAPAARRHRGGALLLHSIDV